MATKKVLIPEIGEVVLAKRRGSRHLRISITAKGVVRVGMPHWTPYAAGIVFARERADWINKHLSKHAVTDFKDGDRIGKAHTIRIALNSSLSKPSSRVTTTEIIVNTPYSVDDERTQAKVKEASHKALKKESEALLPKRLEDLAAKHGFRYKSVNIKSLTSRWGSCSTSRDITLSYFLIQLPWSLIDYVLLHELTHTVHMNHSPDFWGHMEKILPGARKMRRLVNSHKPVATPNSGEIA
ncbi:MAG TPA: SprT family zinc-dependent metalloprotease [Candidatus Saccharimonadales bacterium]|nr:SprT family zinc-dependent metalloprotease [Candidatus Saccharimonadales bacterium]